MFVLFVFGSRDVQDREMVWRTLDELALAQASVFTSGGCKGADQLGEEWARQRGIQNRRIYYPDWEQYGRSAGARRTADLIANELEGQPEEPICIAFEACERPPSGRWEDGSDGGTAITCKMLAAREIEFLVVWADGERDWQATSTPAQAGGCGRDLFEDQNRRAPRLTEAKNPYRGIDQQLAERLPPRGNMIQCRRCGRACVPNDGRPHTCEGCRE